MSSSSPRDLGRDGPTPSAVANEHPVVSVAVSFSDTARTLFGAGDVEHTLAMVLRIAVEMIEGCDLAGICFLEHEVVVSPVATDPLVTELWAAQRRSGEGPCIDAVIDRLCCYVEDLGADLRWPTFAGAAVASRLRSVLALPMTSGTSPGSLVLYSRLPNGLGVVDRAKGQLLASLAALAYSVAHAREDESRNTANLRAALATRELIGQAQGILMEREHITPDEAFDVLRRASQHLNVRLREVALTLIETGERPGLD